MISQVSELIRDLPPGSTKNFEVSSPWDGSLVATVEGLNRTGALYAVALANEAFRNREFGPPPSERYRILQHVARTIDSRRQELAVLIAREGGKPLKDALVEVDRAAESTRIAAEEALRFHGTEIPMRRTAAAEGRWAFTILEPIGTVLGISAFNHPLNLIAHQAAPAIAAGCPVLVKPDLRTPLSCFAYLEMLQEAGLPQEWALPVPCENDVAEEIATSRDIAFLSFIGSARVGWYLRSRLAPGVRCALEHGGTAPVIVDRDCDVGCVAPLVLKGAFYHAGQVCVSVQRLYVHRAIADDIIHVLVAGAKKLKVGDPVEPDTDVGPMILEREVQRVHEWVTEALNAGATLACGGKRVAKQAYEPTILLNPNPDSRVMTEEVFGPVLCVIRFDELEQAITAANSNRWAFQSAIFTRDLSTALEAAKALDASAVIVNDSTAFRVDWMPFGGRRESGLGLGGIPYSVRELLQEKLIVLRRL